MGGGVRLLRAQPGVWGQTAINLDTWSLSAQIPVCLCVVSSRQNLTLKMVDPLRKEFCSYSHFISAPWPPAQTSLCGEPISIGNHSLNTKHIQFILQHQYQAVIGFDILKYFYILCLPCFIFFVIFTGFRVAMETQHPLHIWGSLQIYLTEEGRPTLNVGKDNY